MLPMIEHMLDHLGGPSEVSSEQHRCTGLVRSSRIAEMAKITLLHCGAKIAAEAIWLDEAHSHY